MGFRETENGFLTKKSRSFLNSRKINKGIGAETVHFLGDGLYQTDEI
jgi:hypothetical protein